MSTIKADAITASTGTNTNIAITGKGSGKVAIGDGTLLFPDSDGSTGQYIKTDGSANLAFATLPTGGKVVQVVNTQTGAVATGSTQSPADDTIPQISEGNEYMTVAISPTSSSNKLVIDVHVNWSCATASSACTFAIFQDSTAGAIFASYAYPDNATSAYANSFTHYMTAGTTSATTFRLRCGGYGNAPFTLNGRSGSRQLGGVLLSSITITEISV